MNCAYEDEIDTPCRGCGDSASGWAFRADGTRVYVCVDCAHELYRNVEVTKDNAEYGGNPHPNAQFCGDCEKLTFLDDLLPGGICTDCRHQNAPQGASDAAVRTAVGEDEQ